MVNPNQSTSQCVESAGETVVGIMAKYWTPGNVKTRLGRTIGMDKAAQLHKLFVVTLTRHLASSNASEDVQSASERVEKTDSDRIEHRVIAATPAEKLSSFADEIGPSWSFATQASGDLGTRMKHWFRESLTGSPDQQSVGYPKVDKAILIGADCPTIDRNAIQQASDLLTDHDLVLGPAIDGGYYLIAISGPFREAHNGLFDDIAWSTDRVLSITLQRTQDAGLSVALMQQREDIDTIDSLKRLLSQLRSSATDSDAQLANQIDAVLSDKITEPSVNL